MNQKTVPALAIMAMLWAANAACSPHASVRQSVTLEVIPAVEAAVYIIQVDPVEQGAGAAPAGRAECRSVSLVVTPGAFRGKVTASFGSLGLIEVDVEATAGGTGLARTPLRLTLTDA